MDNYSFSSDGLGSICIQALKMKKIFLALMLLVSASFAFTFPTFYESNGITYKINSSQTFYDSPVCGNSAPPNYVEGATYNLSGSTITALNRKTDPYNGTSQSICYKLNRAGFSYYESSTVYYPDNSCIAPNTIVNGECLPPVPETCEPIDGKYTSPTGTCVDCSGFSSEIDRAQCGCSAIGSSYYPQGGLEFPTSSGGYNYSKQKVTCSNSSEIFVYFNKTPITTDANGTGSSSTTPLNSQLANGINYMGEKLSSLNDTATTMNAGINNMNTSLSHLNTSVNKISDSLDKMLTIEQGQVQYLSNIDGGISQGNSILHEIGAGLSNINNMMMAQSVGADVSTTPHNIPTDTSSASFDTYSDTWNRLTDSISEVSNKVEGFKGLFQNGLPSPFKKSSITTCRYQSSFEFGTLGAVPVDFDLCHVFSPLRPVIYTFVYIFSVFYILVFCVKMFLRLV